MHMHKGSMRKARPVWSELCIIVPLQNALRESTLRKGWEKSESSIISSQTA